MFNFKLFILLNDAPEAWQLGFQDPASPVAQGMIGASFISTIIGTKIRGDGALWYSQNIDFLLPIKVNGVQVTI